ncbi:hypothetical protein EYF80_010205 [Liparis tanakae]|uniref:Uncharacterized protein n=1 Tax=Liparis tanakae TaxID=230148 RepID=A0A4Z2IR15_9TELE|nr:hypothetical protein EYF80_010205 [Liparis tanakae]
MAFWISSSTLLFFTFWKGHNFLRLLDEADAVVEVRLEPLEMRLHVPRLPSRTIIRGMDLTQSLIYHTRSVHREQQTPGVSRVLTISISLCISLSLVLSLSPSPEICRFTRSTSFSRERINPSSRSRSCFSWFMSAHLSSTCLCRLLACDHATVHRGEERKKGGINERRAGRKKDAVAENRNCGPPFETRHSTLPSDTIWSRRALLLLLTDLNQEPSLLLQLGLVELRQLLEGLDVALLRRPQLHLKISLHTLMFMLKILSSALLVGDLPHQQAAILRHRQQELIVKSDHHLRTHKIEHVLKRGDGVDVDDVCVDCRKHVATVAEGTLKMCREKVLKKQQHSNETPRTVNSLTVRMSSMSRFISLSLSEKPTRMKRPLGCRATLCASSWNSLYSSNNLVTEHRGGAMERHGSVSSACHTSYNHDTEHMARQFQMRTEWSRELVATRGFLMQTDKPVMDLEWKDCERNSKCSF